MQVGVDGGGLMGVQETMSLKNIAILSFRGQINSWK